MRTALGGAVALVTAAAGLTVGAAVPAQAAGTSTASDAAALGGTVIPYTDYSIIDEDSEAGAYPAPPAKDGTAAGAIDGDYSTQWAAAYNVVNGDGEATHPFPHWLTIDLGKDYTDLTDLEYSVKVQGNGPVADYKVFVTDDESVAEGDSATATDPTVGWGDAVASGTFHQPTANDEVQTAAFHKPVSGRYVMFEMLSAVNDTTNASASELRLVTGGATGVPAGQPITNSQYTLLGEDSQQTSSGDGSAAAAFDGDYSTQWAAAYKVVDGAGVAGPYPHSLTFDVGGSFTLTGLGYSVKNQGNGPIKDVKVYATDDATIANDPKADWGAPVGTATFQQPSADSEIQYVDFSKPVKARYVKFEGTSAINGSGNASASEIVVYSTDTDTTPSAPVDPTAPYYVNVGDTGPWKYPDDMVASSIIDKDGAYYFGESHALYGENNANHTLRQWKFYSKAPHATGPADMDTAVPDTKLNEQAGNSDTTELCNTSPTGEHATKAPAGSGYVEPNYCDLTALWVDPDTGYWHGLVHNEFTPQPFGDGLHYDAIDNAVSKDQGKTWTITDNVITSPYSTTRGDTAAFPEDTYYYGDGDPRLFVDYSSGYFYVFYGSRIINKNGGWVAFYEHAARAPIADKMAKGSWQKWYDGAWDQPGIGGKESNIVPVSQQKDGYTPPSKEYKPTTPGTAQQQIAAGEMPATSPLFVMDVSYDAYLGLYIAEPQNPDQSGNAPQEIYATKNLATQKWFKLGDTGTKYTTASWYRWFLDPANKTSSAIVGKDLRSYCSFACNAGSDNEYVNLTIVPNEKVGTKVATPVKTDTDYVIGAGDNGVLTQDAAGSGTSAAAEATSKLAAWRFTAVGDGSYTIANAKTGELLGVDSTKTADRAWGTAPVVSDIAAKDATVGQQWWVVPNTDPATGEATGGVRIVNRYSGLVLGLATGADVSAQTVPGRTWTKDAAAPQVRSLAAAVAASPAAASDPAGMDSAAAQSLTLTAYTAPGDGGQSGNGQPGSTTPGDGDQSGNGQPGNAGTGNGQPGASDTTTAADGAAVTARPGTVGAAVNTGGVATSVELPAWIGFLVMLAGAGVVGATLAARRRWRLRR